MAGPWAPPVSLAEQELQELQSLQKLREAYGWEENHPTYVKRINDLQKKYAKLSKESARVPGVKPEEEGAKGRTDMWWGEYGDLFEKELPEKTTFDAAKKYLTEIYDGRWVQNSSAPGNKITSLRLICRSTNGKTFHGRILKKKGEKVLVQEGQAKSFTEKNEEEASEEDRCVWPDDAEDDAETAPPPSKRARKATQKAAEAAAPAAKPKAASQRSSGRSGKR